MTTRSRLARLEAARSPGSDPAAIFAAMTPAEAREWDRLAGAFDDADPQFPVSPDDMDALVALIAGVMRRLGRPVDVVWEQGWPHRYRVDYRDRAEDAGSGRLAGLDVLHRSAAIKRGHADGR